MSKEETKAAQKVTAYETIIDLNNAANEVATQKATRRAAINPADFLALLQLIAAAKPLIIAALKLAKVFTGAKADAKIDEIIEGIEELPV